MLYVLQRHFGISPREALTERADWEIDLLLDGFAREQKAEMQ